MTRLFIGSTLDFQAYKRRKALIWNFRLTLITIRYILYRLRIIRESFLAEAAPANSKAGKWLDAWRIVVKAAEWKNIAEPRLTYPSADPVKVQSGRTVTVFNVCGNDYRLITAIHYDRQRVYTLEFLTHAEYGKNNWKKNL